MAQLIPYFLTSVIMYYTILDSTAWIIPSKASNQFWCTVGNIRAVSCSNPPAKSPLSSEPAEEELTTEAVPLGVQAYRVLIRVTGLGEGFRPPAKGTPAFDELGAQLLPPLRKQLQADKGFYDLNLNSFLQYVPPVSDFPAPF